MAVSQATAASMLATKKAMVQGDKCPLATSAIEDAERINHANLRPDECKAIVRALDRKRMDLNSICVPADFPTLRSALAVCPSGGCVHVRAGVYHEQLVVTKQVLIEAEAEVEIRGEAPVVRFIAGSSGAKISGATIHALTGPPAPVGLMQAQVRSHLDVAVKTGAIEIIDSAPQIDACIVSAKNGGVGIRVEGGFLKTDLFLDRWSDSFGPRIRQGSISGFSLGVLASRGSCSLISEVNFTDSNLGIHVTDNSKVSVEKCSLACASIGLLFDGASGGIVSECQISGSKTGVEICARSDPLLSGAQIKSCGPGPAVLITGQGTRGSVTGCEIVGHVHEGIVVQDKAEPTIEGNSICSGGRNGVILDRRSRGVVRKNKIHDHNGDGILVTGASTTSVEDNEIWACKGAGISVSHCSSCRVISNVIRDTRHAGIQVQDGASPVVEKNSVSGVHGPGICVRTGGCGQMTNNIIENSTHGISVDGALSSPYIAQNILRNNRAGGISVRHAGACEVVGNQITESGGSGLSVVRGIRETRLEKNHVSKSRQAGIAIVDWGHTRAISNEIQNSAGAGIDLDSVFRSTLEFNKIYDGQGPGIAVKGGGSTAIQNNEIKDNAGPGLAVHGVLSAPVSTNVIQGNRAVAVQLWDWSSCRLECNKMTDNGLASERKHNPGGIASKSALPSARGGAEPRASLAEIEEDIVIECHNPRTSVDFTASQEAHKAIIG